MLTKAVGGGLSALVATTGVVAAVYFGSSAETLNVQPASNVYSLSEASKVLDDNLSDAQLQKDKELQEIEDSYELPSGGTFESEYSFPEINEQRSQVAAQMTERSSEESDFQTQEVWYESGYFKSDALVQWQCAWLKEAVLAQEAAESDRFDEAIARLRGFKDRKEISMFPDYDVFLAENVAPLEKGDAAASRAFLNSGYSCVEQNQIGN